jgi:hypothetical protein
MTNMPLHGQRNEPKDVHPQCKYDATQAGAENDFNRTPAFPGSYIQVTGERDSGQQVGEKDVDRTGDNQLIKDLPVGGVPKAEIPDILP